MISGSESDSVVQGFAQKSREAWWQVSCDGLAGR